MAMIDVTCPYCTTRSILPARAMFAALDVKDSGRPLGELSWLCRTCSNLTITDVEWRHLLRLVSAGVPLLDDGLEAASSAEVGDTQASGQVPHPEDPPSGALFSSDDLLTLHEYLQTRAWWEQLGATDVE